MILEKPTSSFIKFHLGQFKENGNLAINDKMLELFQTFKDDTDINNVRIKVAALNEIFSTSIINIEPVITTIVQCADTSNPAQSIDQFVKQVDDIAKIEWTNSQQKKYTRTNLSFASKYVHFTSNYQIPIYDSYIWILINGYLGQLKGSKLVFKAPTDYQTFHLRFLKFRNEFQLQTYSLFEVDKFLWQYCRNLLADLQQEHQLENLNEAKPILMSNLRQKITS